MTQNRTGKTMSEKVILDAEMYSIDDLMGIFGIKTRPGASQWIKRHKVKGIWISVPPKKASKKPRHKKFFSRREIVSVMTGDRHG